MTIHNHASGFALLDASASGNWISPDHVPDYAARRAASAVRPVPTAVKTFVTADGNELHLTANPAVRGISEFMPDCETGGVNVVTTWFHDERPICEIVEKKLPGTGRHRRADFSSYRAF